MKHNNSKHLKTLKSKFENFKMSNWPYVLASFFLWLALFGKDILYSIGKLSSTDISSLMDIAKYLFLLVVFLIFSKIFKCLLRIPSLEKIIEKTEQILDVEAFYPSNYADLPKESKYKVRSFITDAIAQIKEQGVPLIICNEDRHYSLYKDFAEGIVKIYGTATQTPYHYASYEKIIDYIMFFREKNVRRVTILSLNQIQDIIVRNICYIDNEGLRYDRLPEILWYETVFNEQSKHWWFYDKIPNDFLLPDIHRVRAYTNYAIYLINDNHRLLLNYFERRDNTGFFLLRCIPPDGGHDATAIKINRFISAIEENALDDFYSSFEDMVIKENGDDFEKFKAEKRDLLSSKSISATSWQMLFKSIENRHYKSDFIERFPTVELGNKTLKI